MELIVDNTDVQVYDVAATLADRDSPLLTFPRTSLQDVQFDLAKQSLRIGKLNISDGRLSMTSDAQGVHDLQKIMQPLPEKTESPAVAAADGDALPWRLQLDALSVDNLQLEVTEYRYVQTATVQATVSELGLRGAVEIGDVTQVQMQNILGRLNQLAVRIGDEIEPWAVVDSVGLENGTFDLQNKSIRADAVRIQTGYGRIWLDADKQINWLKAFSLREEGSVDIVLETVKQVLRDDQNWSVGVKTVSVNDFKAGLTDKSVDPPADFNLQNATVVLTNVSNQIQTPTEFDIKVDVKEGGQLQADGNVIPGKAAVDARVQANAVDLRAAQSYVSAFVPLTVESGSVDLKGRLNTLSADQRINITYDGGVNVSRLRVKETASGRPFAGFGAMDIPEMKLSLAPDSLQIKTITVKAPEGRLVIEEDRSINLVKILEAQGAAKENADRQPQTQTPAAEFPIAVQRIRIEDGQLDIADQSLTPRFGMQVRELNGVVSGLTSSKQSRASINMNGRIDDYGRLKLDGQLAPLQPTDNMDVKMVVENLAMPSLTPYTVKFAGRKIDSGKLFVDMDYRLKQKRLSGDHQIVADRLELGPKMEGKGEYDLPVDLAVALLKDPNDRINLKLAVDGRVDDPQFNLGQLMGQAFNQVLGNIVAAPFSMLGRMVGAQPDTRLDAVGFEPGRTQPPPPEMEKLDLIANGLRERPDLVLQVRGQYHKGNDGRYLRSVAVRREIARRMQPDSAENEDPGPLDTDDKNVQKVIETMIAERYSPEVLAQLKSDYQKDSGAMTASTAGQAAQAEEVLHRRMFEYLVEQQPLDGSALNRLAQERSDGVLKTLTGDGQIDPARVAVLEPGSTENLQNGLIQTQLSLTATER
jgi:hypothetical protein